MKNLIEALQIFLKYGDEEYPLFINENILHIYGFHDKDISGCDLWNLNKLGFYWCDSKECFISKEYVCTT